MTEGPLTGLLTGAAAAVDDGRGQAVGDGPDPVALVLRDAKARLPVPPVTDRGVWDAVDARTRDGLLRLAARWRARPAPVLRASDWARSFRDGNRTAHEDAARELRTRTAAVTLAAVLSGEHAAADAPPDAVPDLDAAADGITALCEMSTWCWAPHDAHTAARREVLPDPDDPYLDLGAAEVGGLLAWADHVLGPHLDVRVPGLRRRIRREVRSRLLTPFTTRRDWPWLGLDRPADNWNAWIHSAVVIAAVTVIDDPGEQAAVLRLVLSGLDRFLAALPDDGGIDEGVAYWWHGAGRLWESLELLAAVGGPTLDARRLPILGRLARFPHRMHLGGLWYVNAGDGPALLSGTQPWHLAHRWGRTLSDAAVRDHAAARGGRDPLAVRPEAGLGSALVGLVDEEWRAAHTAARATAGPVEPSRRAVQPGEADRTPVSRSEPGAWGPDAIGPDVVAPEVAGPGAAGVGGADVRRPSAGHDAVGATRTDLAGADHRGTDLAEPHLPGVDLSGLDSAAGRDLPASNLPGPDPDGDRGSWLSRDDWLPRVQVLVARETAGTTRGLTLAAKAGHNGERHNHLDVGSYWVALDGTPLIVDVGQPTYTAGSFGANRYDAWPLRSEWHNVPEPGAAQPAGAEHAARDVAVERTERTTALHAELAGVYPAGLLARWSRSIRLIRATGREEAHVVIDDSWESAAGAPVLLRHVLAGTVELASGRAIVTPASGRALLVSWDPTLLVAEVERRPLDDPLLRASWGAQLTRLTLGAVSSTVTAARVRLAAAS
ncbi:hypothetical protein FHR81_004965 [Actinoalloteichus hoggarensis]|uniref:Heparinase II/III-like protein n=1 Tax=Actinoalloteichus hoggarensis TaxID=1470176 RepID=A0A221W9N0_9PSEU|nr:heparinase II/III family protein [Actinoalloteichus hoggarensis]ASO22027.1 Heparinase II/III-like protein [Actinoalloteichus hoggarensis]MBB5923892.1 hypothetical protein [Actinoalloteichus hoggarensis]